MAVKTANALKYVHGIQRSSKRRIDENRAHTRKPSDIVSDVIMVCATITLENTLSTKKANKSGFSMMSDTSARAVLTSSTEWPSVSSEELIAAIYAGGE